MSCFLWGLVSRSVRGHLTVSTPLSRPEAYVTLPRKGRDAEEISGDIGNDPHGSLWRWLAGFGIRLTWVPVQDVQVLGKVT